MFECEVNARFPVGLSSCADIGYRLCLKRAIEWIQTNLPVRERIAALSRREYCDWTAASKDFSQLQSLVDAIFLKCDTCKCSCQPPPSRVSRQ